jgi:hypothetical protein
VLNTMSSGLIHAHAGEMLINEQKSKVLKSSSLGEILTDEKTKVQEQAQ